MSQFDLIVIGAGPAGYVAAIRAAQLGMNTCLVEARKSLGGTCLNVGCIPSKALLQSSEKYEEANTHLQDHGITVSKPKLDLATMIGRKDGVVKQLTGGIEMLMKKNKITVKQGWASFKGANTITLDDGKEDISAKNILIAAGSEPVELPFAKYDHNVVVDSTDALSFESVPKHLVVIGAGVIGLELGSVWRRLGAEVTLIDVAERPLMVMDGDLSKTTLKIFEKQGLKFNLGAKVQEIKTTKTGATLTLENAKGETETLKADKVLVSVGRRANTDKLNLDAAGIKTDERGVIQVNEQYQTSVPSVYAVGDCAPGPMLAHKGEEEGVACVEMLAGQKPHVNYNCIPWVVYTHPEVAGVGLTQEQCKEQNIPVKAGKFNFAASGRALAMGVGEGFVKVLAHAETDEVLGVHIIGPGAAELIAEAAIAMEFKASAEDIARTCHAHPTLAETIKEAALATDKRAIHG
ncbi:MAG: dihydrolipoyl dehydrogenase [Alphaproteobacteria bacterium]|nr:dihydrolipoyl dehydrogenase [Alphaproteobacteria bacterium]MDD9920445.1 dihydrolipoyl dehydrogenase [Alphaproteobacteria bacterium]